jgi:DNA-binding CsgD family transcriptional regulator
MIKTTLIFGFSLATLLILLKWLEYSFFIKDLTLETYSGIVGGICMVLGIWMGWKLTRKRSALPEEGKTVLTREKEEIQFDAPSGFNLSPREYEVLVLIAQGLSYQEIADKLFVSLNTVKTHSSNIFSKMNVQRKTQAVMLAQQKGILPPLKV